MDVPVDDVIALMYRFCSIGADCEFGIVQGRLGCKSIDLLRKAYTPVSSLTELLDGNLHALADPALLRLNVETDEGHFMAFNDRFGMHWHGRAKPDGSSMAILVEREARRMSGLADKFAEDLAAGERIMVRRAGTDESLDDAIALHKALSRHGDAALLWVDRGAGPLERHNRVLHGHLTPGADVPDAANVRATDWLALCREVAGVMDRAD